MVYTDRNITGLVFPEVKADRALQLLNQLEPEIEKFRTSGFYTIKERDHIKKHQHIKTITFEPTPDLLPLLLGEFLYNLRSALDQLAWQLALLHTPAPHARTWFPIRLNAEPARFKEDTKQFSDSVRDVIESIQPYKHLQPAEHPLWLLNELSNIDKHVLPAFRSNDYKIDITGANDIKEKRRESRERNEFTFSLSDKFKAKITVTLEGLTLGKSIDAFGPAIDVPQAALRQIHRFVNNEAFPAFAKFFPLR
jgi:hypothetical protein